MGGLFPPIYTRGIILASITLKCGRCGGTGIDNNSADENGDTINVPCLSCGETGRIEAFVLDDADIMDKFDDIIDKLNDIKEAVDAL